MPQFEPGKSGNTKGRPPGRPDKRNALRRLLEPHAKALVDKAIALALCGDVAALRMCLDRLIPPLRASSLPVACDLGIGSLTERGEAIMRQASDGAMSPEQANLLLGGLASLARIRESDAIARQAGEKTYEDYLRELHEKIQANQLPTKVQDS